MFYSQPFGLVKNIAWYRASTHGQIAFDRILHYSEA